MRSLFDMTISDPDYKDDKTMSKTITNESRTIQVTIKAEDPKSETDVLAPEPKVAFCGVIGRYGLVTDRQSEPWLQDAFFPFGPVENRSRDVRRASYFKEQIRQLEKRREMRRVQLNRLFSQVSVIAQDVATLKTQEKRLDEPMVPDQQVTELEERAMQRRCELQEMESVAEDEFRTPRSSPSSDPSIWERLDVSGVNEEMD